MKWQKLFDINSTFAAINRQRIYPSYGGNKSKVWRALSLRIGNTLRMISQNSFFSVLHPAEREFHVLEQIQQVAIQYWVIAQTLVIFQTNLKGTAQLQLLQLLWALGDVIFYPE